MNAVYYREAAGALIVYDQTDVDSFAKVKQWALELRKYLDNETPIVIAGNKCDLPTRAVDLEEAQAYARQNGF